MSTELGWQEILLRLVLTVVAGALIGFNREKYARSAGLRTMMLVTLAASVSMIQVNLLLGMSGKTPSSFAVMDLMRLPLGILSGMGFIGAGAILRKETAVTGVTTAATLWFSTVIGLCLGGGQIGLGLASLGLALLIIWGLKAIELHWLHPRQGQLSFTCDQALFSRQTAEREINKLGGRIDTWMEALIDNKEKCAHYACQVTWETRAEQGFLELIPTLSMLPGVHRAEWRTIGHVG